MSFDPEHPVEFCSEGERPAPVVPKKNRKTTKGSFNQDNSSCMTGGTGTTLESVQIGEPLRLYRRFQHYERTKDTWRSKAYRVAIGMLKKQPSLQEISEHYERMEDTYLEIKACRVAIRMLEKQTVKIATVEQAKNSHGTGDRLGDKDRGDCYQRPKA